MPSASYPPRAVEVRVSEVLTADEARDPDRWLAALAWLVVGLSLLQILLFGFGREQAAHALVGEAILRGEAPYRDVWDPSAPGIFLLHAAVQALLGKSMLALRLVEVGGLLCLVFSCRSLGASVFGSPTAGLLGGALAALVHAQLEFVHTGHPESFAGVFTVGALAVTLRFDRSVQRQAVLLGLLLGGLLAFKPTLAAIGVVCVAHLVRRLQITRGAAAAVAPALITALSALAPILACLAWFHSRGASAELWWTLTDLATARAEAAAAGRSAPELFYTASAEALVGASSLVAVGLIAALLQRPVYAREREALFLVFGVLSIQLAAIALEATFSPHHFGATLPLLALVAGLGWYKLWRRLLPSGPSGLLALAAFTLVVGSMREPTRELPEGFWRRSAVRLGYLLRVGAATTREALDARLSRHGDYDLPAVRRLAEHLSHELSPGDTLHITFDEPLLYWLSSARPATPFVRGAPPPFPDSPTPPPFPPELLRLPTSLERLRPQYMLQRASASPGEASSAEAPPSNAPPHDEVTPPRAPSAHDGALPALHADPSPAPSTGTRTGAPTEPSPGDAAARAQEATATDAHAADAAAHDSAAHGTAPHGTAHDIAPHGAAPHSTAPHGAANHDPASHDAHPAPHGDAPTPAAHTSLDARWFGAHYDATTTMEGVTLYELRAKPRSLPAPP